MISSTRLSFAALALALGIVSCKRDKEAPQIRHVEVNDEAGEHFHAIAGRINQIIVHLTDNESVEQARIYLHPFTGLTAHNHDGTPMVFNYDIIGSWEKTDVQYLRQKDVMMRFNPGIPADLSGPWMMAVAAVDEEGNMTEEHYEFHLFNDSLPVLLVNTIAHSIDEMGVIQLDAATPLAVDADFLDTDGLASVSGEIYSGMTEVFSFEETVADEITFSLTEVSFPVLATPGAYTLKLRATDSHGFSNSVFARIAVQ